jgi:amino acid adenylation domain-containing protein
LPIETADRTQPLVLSWAQQRLWFLDQLDHAASGAYHMTRGLRLRGRLDTTALQATFDALIQRHEALRTTFVARSGEPEQRVGPIDAHLTILVEDLSYLEPTARQDAVDEYCALDASRPFDLASGPLLRVRLVQLAEEDHVLIITKHHIVSDAWSVGLLIREVQALYSAFTAGRPNPLPPLEVQYPDYAAWQREWLQGDRLSQQVNFWKEYLAGAPQLLDLPTDRPRRAVQRHVGTRLPFELTPELTKALHAVSRRHGTTLFMTMLAGWSAMLSRVCGQDDIVVGTPVAGRQRKDLEPLIGFFANTLALRVRFDGDPTVAQMLARVKDSAIAAYSHQEIPFEQVVDALQPARSLDHNPLFQVNITIENVPTDSTLSLPGLEVELFDLPHTTTQFDLALHLVERDDALQGRFYFSTDLFDPSTIERLGSNLKVLLQGMVADQSVTLSQLPLLAPPERHRILHAFNDTDAHWDLADGLIHETFARAARDRPTVPAIIYGDRSLTYREVDERSNQIAHLLLSQGVGPDRRVALCMERGVDALVALLSVLKAGGAYVPVDPAYPAERVAYLLGDSAPVAILTHLSILPGLPPCTVPVIAVDDPDTIDAIARQSAAAPQDVGAESRNLAYVIYTSGSTGLPKGVMVEHHSVLNLWRSLDARVYGREGRIDRVGLNAPLSFDASVQGVIQLLSGRTVIVIPQDVRLDAAAMRDYLRGHEVDAFDCTPTQLELLVKEGLFARADYGPTAVLVGGEAISRDLWRALQAIEGTNFYNLYGPTECTVDTTSGNVRLLGEHPSIGRPMDNIRVYILDRSRQPVPTGVTGEVYVAGAGVARGYLNRPELTSERFVADPFAPTDASNPSDGLRMYRTGDLARWRPDGSIEYIGRNDFQVKLRGFRIELGEIETQLRSATGVAEATVIVREDLPGDKRLVAYVVPSFGEENDTLSLRKYLGDRLPEYMVPAAIVGLAALPLTANGKLDRAALPSPEGAAFANAGYEEPVSATEWEIADLWKFLLGVERVGRHDNFFDLGGYSLTAIQVVSRLREMYEVSLPLAKVFQAATVAQLAAVVVEEQLSAFKDEEISGMTGAIADMTESELRSLLNSAD